MEWLTVKKQLKDVVGSKYFSDKEYELWCYSGNMLPKDPLCVVRPAHVEDIARITQIANKENIPLIPRGLASRAVTGGEGTFPPTTGGIIIDFTRMNRIREISEDTMTVTVEAGATMAEVNTALAPRGFRVIEGTLCPYCATVGSLIGYGPGDFKYGPRTEQVMDIEVVLSDGRVLLTGTAGLGWGHMAKYHGLDLTGLFLETRGTLGLVTAVTFAMYPLPEYTDYHTYAFKETESLVKFISKIQRESITHLPALYELYMWTEATFKLYKNRPQIINQNQSWESLMNRFPPYPSDVIGITLEGMKDQIDSQVKMLDEFAEKLGGENIGPEPARDHYVDRNWEGNTKYCEDAMGQSTSWAEPGFRCRTDQYKLFRDLTEQIAVKCGFEVGKNYWRGARVGARTISNFPVVTFDDTNPEQKAAAQKFHKSVFDAVLHYGGMRSVGAVFGNLQSSIPYEISKGIKKLLDPKNIMFSGLEQ